MTGPSHSVTQLLEEWGGGNRDALERLMPLVYDELRRQAKRYMRREAEGHVLQTTALVHEAYLRLVDQRQPRWQNRAQFFGVAAQLMRRILVDHARGQQAAKRGRSAIHVPLDEELAAAREPDVDLLALDEALEKLAEKNDRLARLVELRYFGGLSVEETAEVMGVSRITVIRHWNMAKAWLTRELEHEG